METTNEATLELAPSVVELEPDEIASLKQLAATVTANPSSAADVYCRQAQRAGRSMPHRLQDLLWTFKNNGTAAGCMLFRGFPVVDADLPDTPPGNTLHLGELTELATVQAILNQTFGEMLAYEAEGYGKLFQDMVPNNAQAKLQTSLGSGVELELHTEQAFSNLKPNILSLGCLRGHPDAITYTMPVRTLLAHLTPAECELARQPLWMTGVDASFCMGGHDFLDGTLRGPMPLVSGAPDDPVFVFDQDLMRGTTPESEALISRVVAVYKATRSSTVLTPGCVLLIDNVRSVHGRSPFSPKFDGGDRFITRSFIVRDLVRTRYARTAGSRVCAARYS